MFFEKKRKNGPRLLIAPNKNTKATTVLILVGAGSRYETDDERGIAHFLEHMFFKGGKIFDTPKKVAETIDAIGADFNAFTGKEYAGYYVKCAGEHKETAFAVLSDMLLNTKLDPNDIKKEQKVIIEELNMYLDTPMYQIGWDFENLLFGDTPLGRDTIGIPETILSFSDADFRHFRKELYTADNTIVVVSGDTTDAEKLTEKFFVFDDRQKSKSFQPEKSDRPKKIHIRPKNTEQAHLVIGFPGVARGDATEIATRLLAIILGGNMSSRMFLKIREERGLCYSVSTSSDHFSDCGVFSTHAGVDISRVAEAISAICAEYAEISQNGISDDELQKAKSFLKGKLTLKFEDSEEIASFLGTSAILGKEILSPDDLFQKIDAVKKADIDALAAKLFQKEKIKLAAIGPFSGRENEFEKLITEKF